MCETRENRPSIIYSRGADESVGRVMPTANVKINESWNLLIRTLYDRSRDLIRYMLEA